MEIEDVKKDIYDYTKLPGTYGSSPLIVVIPECERVVHAQGSLSRFLSYS